MKYKMKSNTLTVLAIISLFTACANAQSGGQFSITSSVIAGGGASSGGAFSVNGTAGQAAAGSGISATPYDLSSGFWAQVAASANESGVSVTGNVRTSGGRGITNAMLTLTAADSTTRVVLSGRSGTYRFDNVPTGSNYTLNVTTRRFSFASPTVIISVQDQITGLDFVANQTP